MKTSEAVLTYLLVVATLSAGATDNYWLGGSSASLDDAANWSEGVAPVRSARTGNTLVFTNSVSSTPQEHLYATHLRVAEDCTVSIGGDANHRLYLNGERLDGVFGKTTVDIGKNATLTLYPQLLGMYGWYGDRTTLVKRGAGLMEIYERIEDFTDIRVEGGTLWFRAASGNTCIIGESCKYLITVCDGARVELVCNNPIDNRMTVQVESGGVFGGRYRSDVIGAVAGAGLVSDGVFELSLYNGPHVFSGAVSNATISLRKFTTGTCATTDEQFGFVIGSANTFDDPRSTLTIDPTSVVSPPESPEKCCVRFAPGIGTFRVGEFNGSAVHPVYLADTDGNAVTMRVVVATADYVCGPRDSEQRGCILFARDHTFNATLGEGADLGAVNGATVTIGPDAEIDSGATLRFNKYSTLDLGGRTITVRRFVGGGKWRNGKLFQTDRPGLLLLIK